MVSLTFLATFPANQVRLVPVLSRTRAQRANAVLAEPEASDHFAATGLALVW